MWLTDFREEHGLDIHELAVLIRRYGAKKRPPKSVSERLLWLLEVDPDFVTVPGLANLIAEACGATGKQRDELVLPKYKGTWKQRERAGNAPILEMIRRSTREQAALSDNRCRPVLLITRDGVAVRRFEGANNAARHCGCCPEAVLNRCNRRVVSWEFGIVKGFTWRWADEWDTMNNEQRLIDIRRTIDLELSKRGGSHFVRPVVGVGRDGTVKEYKSVTEAAFDVGVSAGSVSQYLGRRKRAPFSGMVYVKLTEWMEMSPEARAKLAKIN